MNKRVRKENDWAEYYDHRNILDEITDESVYLSLDDHLRQDILSGKRKRKLKNITIKINPFHITAIKKLATMKSMPYQTLIRHWLAEEIKKELELVER
jgi:predicted DNA binding CopG/RHH family protein